jgi:hypothetical protein
MFFSIMILSCYSITARFDLKKENKPHAIFPSFAQVLIHLVRPIERVLALLYDEFL